MSRSQGLDAMTAPAHEVVCIGGAAVDRKYRAQAPVRLGTSNPVTAERSFGGVARNIAETIVRLGQRCRLISIVGDDENGRAIRSNLDALGIDTRHMVTSPEHATAEYVAVLHPNGDLAVGVADMAIFDALSPELLHEVWPTLSTSAWVFMDCNLPPETVHEMIDLARQQPFKLAVDAVSTAKVMRLPHDLRGIDLLCLNGDEAIAFLGLEASQPSSPCRIASDLLDCGAARVVLTLGAAGLVAADSYGIDRLSAPKAQVVDATGAGDALVATMIVSLMREQPLVKAARLGMAAAALTIESTATVRPDLSFALLEAALYQSESSSAPDPI